MGKNLQNVQPLNSTNLNNSTHWLERLLIECRKTKTKPVTELDCSAYLKPYS